MIIEKLEVGVFAENCYVVGCDATGEGVVIDPGDESKRIIDLIKRHHLDIKYILLTHGHIDHIKDVPLLKEVFDVPVLMHREDQFFVDNLATQGAAFGINVSRIPKIDRYINDKDSIAFGKVHFSIMHTPGHSPGSVTFYVDDVAFSGDVLFAGSIGRTDLPGGNFQILMTSITKKLLPLGENIQVFPGHGPTTTIGRESKSNPFLIDRN